MDRPGLYFVLGAVWDLEWQPGVFAQLTRLLAGATLCSSSPPETPPYECPPATNTLQWWLKTIFQDLLEEAEVKGKLNLGFQAQKSDSSKSDRRILPVWQAVLPCCPAERFEKETALRGQRWLRIRCFSSACQVHAEEDICTGR